MAKTIVDWKTISSFVTDAFVGVGVPREDAEICTDVLLESDRRGIESHGVNRFKPIYIDRINIGIQNPVTNFEIVKETPTTAVIDGHDGMGQVIGYKSMKMAIDKAKKYGLGMVAVRNSCHYGIAGYYATMATKENMIGITGTNARPSIAPTFGVENMLGTNPLTVGMPTDEDFPFVLDCATSITQRGKLEYYSRIGKSTPAGMVIGRDGTAKTDTDAILKELNTGEAALAPLGGIGEEMAGYKGYGYATVVELLSAALQQGNYLKCSPVSARAVKKCLIIWGISFLQLTRRPLWERNPSKKQRAIFCVRCVLLPGRQAKTISSPPARRSGTFGANAKTAACRLTTRCRRSFAQCATNWA